MTRNIFIALAVALTLYQLVTVRPLDEALVRAFILTSTLALLYALVLTVRFIFKRR